MTMEIKVGNPMVAVSQNGGLPPEYFAGRIVDKLMSVSDTAPEPIRAQAYEFKDRMFAVILAGIVRAIESDRNYRR
jgi:hypothetical protein